MTERIKSLLERTFDKEQAKFRRDVDWKPLLERFVAEGIGDEARARIGLEEMLKAETPAFMDGERLAFLRTVRQIPDLHTDAEMDVRRAAGSPLMSEASKKWRRVSGPERTVCPSPSFSGKQSRRIVSWQKSFFDDKMVTIKPLRKPALII